MIVQLYRLPKTKTLIKVLFQYISLDLIILQFGRAPINLSEVVEKVSYARMRLQKRGKTANISQRMSKTKSPSVQQRRRDIPVRDGSNLSSNNQQHNYSQQHRMSPRIMHKSPVKMSINLPSQALKVTTQQIHPNTANSSKLSRNNDIDIVNQLSEKQGSPVPDELHLIMLDQPRLTFLPNDIPQSQSCPRNKRMCEIKREQQYMRETIDYSRQSLFRWNNLSIEQNPRLKSSSKQIRFNPDLMRDGLNMTVDFIREEENATQLIKLEQRNRKRMQNLRKQQFVQKEQFDHSNLKPLDSKQKKKPEDSSQNQQHDQEFKVEQVTSAKGLASFDVLEDFIEKTEKTYITVQQSLDRHKELKSNLSLVTYEPENGSRCTKDGAKDKEVMIELGGMTNIITQNHNNSPDFQQKMAAVNQRNKVSNLFFSPAQSLKLSKGKSIQPPIDHPGSPLQIIPGMSNSGIFGENCGDIMKQSGEEIKNQITKAEQVWTKQAQSIQPIVWNVVTTKQLQPLEVNIKSNNPHVIALAAHLDFQMKDGQNKGSFNGPNPSDANTQYTGSFAMNSPLHLIDSKYDKGVFRKRNSPSRNIQH